jgi:hypothetical protein
MFFGMLYPIHAINLNMLNVKGRSDLFLKLEIVKKTIGVFPILLGIFFSIEWMLWGGVVTSFIAYYLNTYYSGRLINYSILAQVKDVMPGFVIAMSMAATVWCITLLPLSFWVMLPLQILVGVAIFFCAQ